MKFGMFSIMALNQPINLAYKFPKAVLNCSFIYSVYIILIRLITNIAIVFINDGSSGEII